jgi:CheY-like chemotaxis protein
MSSRILVINDDQSTLELFQLILESDGYEVLLAQRAMEGVSQIEQQHPHLIILDVKLGTGADGLRFLHDIRRYPPTTALPVILCTAAVGEMCEHEEVLRQEGIPVLYKPFDLDELLQAIHQCLPASSIERREKLA